ncbi:hypothetical protein HDA32_004437 [Spinactinospora alkalitolerans]|uniref:DUF1707 domain-containing protein n=1 Tax=Spinactinospora alkalitolerans TaxID=687207 RepID=A0A852U171_9ACTN|nr:DUF1707 domain-containing protein [Spinactinospora alkalitolerans]NYE49317.1 hypothetical protein [Spinactinospora alkalitolerans]
MRASDADRDRVAEILREAAGEGRITLDELDERLDRTYRARTYDDLAPLTADLPTQPDAPSTPRPEGAVLRAGSEQTLELKAKAGTITRKGNWQVPGRVVVKNPYGDTRLNFRDATLLSTIVELDITASWGDAKIILPDGASADINVDTSWFGSVDSRVREAASPPAPHFKITGGVKGGSLKVRYKMKFDDWLSWDDWD